MACHRGKPASPHAAPGRGTRLSLLARRRERAREVIDQRSQALARITDVCQCRPLARARTCRILGPDNRRDVRALSPRRAGRE
eukprot:13354821-Alexandrium_andersonii.AAC.1